jgi:hypothetical protein
MLVAYVSGHGYGHFIRAGALLERVAARTPVHLCANARALELAHRARWAASVREVDVGPGLLQRGPLELDVDATGAALEAHLAAWPSLVDQEATFLRESGARLVLGDVPPLAFAAAARAGVPSVALANFSWSWMYSVYAERDRRIAAAVAPLRAAEAQATLLLALSMSRGLDAFPRQRAIAPVARALTRPPSETRARLPFGADLRPLVLLSFGGFGRDLSIEIAPSPRHNLLVVNAQFAGRDGMAAIDPDRTELHHQDLVASVDCVIGKPGYGTVAECLRRPTPFCFATHGDFPEHLALLDGVRRWLPSAPIALDELRSGAWAATVDRARAVVPPERAPAPDGADEALRILEAWL